MFDVFAKLLSSIASFLFPLFASYKALKTSDPAQLTPWLMYWVVLACALLVESWTEWFLVWIPLYPYVRLLFLLYLVLPQTQGARIIYTTYVHPYLEDNESQIEDLIATTHDKMKAAGMAYIKRAIELLRTQILGMAPSPESQARAADSNIPAAQRPRSYTQALLDRFQLPQGRWPGSGSAGTPAQDFYNFLAGAMSAATGASAGKENEDLSISSAPGGGDAAPGAFPDLTASGTLVPPSIRDDAAKMTFLAAQRERLNLVLSALDREAASLRSGSSGATSPLQQQLQPEDINLDGVQTPSSDLLSDNNSNRPATSASGRSGRSALSKSRSEADFEKIEAESDAENNPAQDSDSARPTPAVTGAGSWMPWGWGAGGAAKDGEKSKAE